MKLSTLCVLAGLASALALGAPAGGASAMSVSPMQIEMASVGKSGRAQFTVTNTSSQPLPVETVISRLDVGEHGATREVAANEDFLVFPPQALIKPGASQVFRVQWVGEPNLAESQSYVLAVTQIPVKLPATRSAVQIVMSFGILIDVAPPAGAPALEVVETGVAAGKDGRPRPTITVDNPSNVHALLKRATLRVTAGGWSKTYSPSEISQAIGIGLVQPGKRRKFMLPDVLPAGAGEVEASIDYPGSR